VELRAFWKEWTQSGEHAVNERLVARGMAGESGHPSLSDRRRVLSRRYRVSREFCEYVRVKSASRALLLSKRVIMSVTSVFAAYLDGYAYNCDHFH
jgi:hypothetical protein